MRMTMRILFVCCAVLALLVGVASAIAGGGASPKASHATAHSTVTTHVTVTATDLKFTLSKRSVPTGTVIFTVKNKGKLSHDFKIAGKKTPRLLPGHSAMLRVTFSKKGRYPYLSTVFGQASHGMKGVFSVVAPTLAPTGTPTPTTTPEPTTPGAANTTVAVDMFDNALPGKFTLSQRTIPSGMVTFVITNNCDGQCSFDLEGIRAGAILDPRQSETWTVALAPGVYRFHCDVDPFMKGTLTVVP